MSLFIKIKDLTTLPSVGFLLYHLVRLYCGTFRLRVENEQAWLACLQQGGKVLLCAWHQQFFPAIRYFEQYRRFHPGIMISQSRDGEIIAAVARRAGWHPVRGSSSRGGTRAMRLVTEELQRSGLAAHIVDGPRGPAGTVKAGAIQIALAAEAVIVPFYTSADRAWYFGSWDRFMLPKPFAAVTIRFGEMIRVAPADTEGEFENQRRALEKTMLPEIRQAPVAGGEFPRPSRRP